jgi:ribosomal protein L31E
MAKITTKPSKIIRASAAPSSVGEQIRHHMSAIAELFDKPKLTLVIRSRSLEGDLIVSNDEANEAIIAIKKYCEQHSRQDVVALN